jgi:CheY-like chemotaxis protein/Tfp pilus assembly protein PilZ
MIDDRTKKILIVDDNETFLMNISIILHRMGFKKVIPAYNGVEALKIIRVLMPDVILLDIAMSQMDGITVLRHIKGDDYTSNIPVIMATITSNRKSYEECEKLGCSGYLKKPVKITELYSTLNKCISYPINKKRKFLRTLFKKKVIVDCKGVREEQYAENLSQRGIFVRKRKPFSVGTEVGIALPLQGKKIINLNGTVIYVKEGNESETPLGMAIEFKDLITNDSEILRKYIIELLTKGIIEDQDEPPLIIEK